MRRYLLGREPHFFQLRFFSEAFNLVDLPLQLIRKHFKLRKINRTFGCFFSLLDWHKDSEGSNVLTSMPSKLMRCKNRIHIDDCTQNLMCSKCADCRWLCIIHKRRRRWKKQLTSVRLLKQHLLHHILYNSHILFTIESKLHTA